METLGPTHAISQSLREGTPLTGHRLGDALDDLRDCGCIDKAYAAARREALQALFYLEPFPPGRYRDALEELALHVVDRPLNG